MAQAMGKQFSGEQYERMVAKAQERELKLYASKRQRFTFNTQPDGTGYTVTVRSCSCLGGQGHGACYHRAYLVARLHMEALCVAQPASEEVAA